MARWNLASEESKFGYWGLTTISDMRVIASGKGDYIHEAQTERQTYFLQYPLCISILHLCILPIFLILSLSKGIVFHCF